MLAVGVGGRGHGYRQNAHQVAKKKKKSAKNQIFLSQAPSMHTDITKERKISFD